MHLIHRGLSLLEIVIVLTLIAVMMALSLPMLNVANATARSELCQQNLIEIGQIIAGHTQDHGRLPTLHNLAPTQGGLSLPQFIEPRSNIPRVTFCPGDETDISQVMGTSYRWSMAFNDQDPSAIPTLLGQRMLADREAFHHNSVLPLNEMVIAEDEAGFRLSLIGENPQNSKTKNHRKIYLKEKKPKKQKTPKQPNLPNLPN